MDPYSFLCHLSCIVGLVEVTLHPGQIVLHPIRLGLISAASCTCNPLVIHSNHSVRWVVLQIRGWRRIGPRDLELGTCSGRKQWTKL